MKSQLTLLIMLLITGVVSAQLGPGSLYTGACLKYNYYTSGGNTQKNSEFYLYPALYYSLNQNWGFGGGISYDVMTTKTDNPSAKTTTNSYWVEPGFRYYGKISDRVNCYWQSNLEFGGGMNKYDGATSYKTTSTYLGLGGNPGIMWNVKDKVYFDFSYGALEYLHTSTKDKDSGTKTNDNSFLINLNPWSVGVGLFYDFGSTK